MRRSISAILIAVTGTVMAASPAHAKQFAPQPVDATDQGALGFVLMAVMCGLIIGALFFLDKIRQRKGNE